MGIGLGRHGAHLADPVPHRTQRSQGGLPMDAISFEAAINALGAAGRIEGNVSRRPN